MRNSEEIKRLAYERLEEANILCDNKKYDGAFYLVGYSIELMLKAKICERFDVNNLFDEACTTKEITNVRNKVKVHDIVTLLIFSGLKEKLKIEKGHNSILMKTYTRLFDDKTGHCFWNEKLRYQPPGTQNPEDVLTLMILLGHEEGLLKWIEKS